MRQTTTAGWLIAAAVLFWVSWALMPAVGITDAQQILTLVAQQRDAVRLSAILQLVSAACYAPALVGIARANQSHRRPIVEIGAILLLIGAMGSVADAILHLVAYEMTAPDASAAQLVPVMARLQGPDLVLIAPLLLAYLVGALLFAIGFARDRATGTGNPLLFALALVIAILGSQVLAGSLAGQRIVGLIVLALVSISQIWIGIALLTGRDPNRRLSKGKRFQPGRS
jgi:hypothetical protein